MNKIHRNEMWDMGPCCLHVMKCESECLQTLASLRNARACSWVGEEGREFQSICEAVA